MENNKGQEMVMDILKDILPEEAGELTVTPEAGKETGKETGKAGKAGKAKGGQGKAGKGQTDTGKAGKDNGKAGKPEAGKADGKSLQETVKAIQEEKEKAIKFIYGIGGQVWSIYPIIIKTDYKENPFIMDIINKGIQGNPTGQQLATWAKTNGTVNIIPIHGGEWKFYMVTLNPVKQITFKPWELEWGTGTSKLSYTVHKEATTGKQVKAGEMVLTNITSNWGKAYHQARALGKVFQMDYTPAGETEKTYYKWDGKRENIMEYGKNSHNPTGKQYKSLEEITGHKMAQFQNWAGVLEQIK